MKLKDKQLYSFINKTPFSVNQLIKFISDNYTLNELNATVFDNFYPLLTYLIFREIPENDLIFFCSFLKESLLSFDKEDHFGWTPVHYSVVKNYKFLTQFLLDKGFICDKKSKQLVKPDKYYYLIGTTPLHICAWHSNVELAEILIKYGALPHAVNASGWTLLHIACYKNCKIFVELGLRNCIDPDVGGSKKPLHVCARWNYHELITILIHANASVDSKNSYGQTPLFVAVKNSNKEAINAFLKYGANIHEKDNFGNNLLHILVDTKLTEIVEDLLDQGINCNELNQRHYTPLHLCARENNFKMAKILIEYEAHIDIQDRNGDTPLIIAARYNNVEMIEILMKSNSNPNIFNVQGYTAMHICVEEGNVEAIKYLVSVGDCVNKSTEIDKLSPLHLAIMLNREKVVECLSTDLKEHIDLNLVDKNGFAPIHLAAKHGNEKIVEMLLKAGAKVNKCNKITGQTALHACAESMKVNVSLLKILIDYDADISIEDNDEITPLALAAASGNYDMVKYLVDRKANYINSKGETVFHICARLHKLDYRAASLLISEYGIENLLRCSMETKATPLHDIISYDAHEVFEALTKCENISFAQWASLLTNPSSSKISVMEYATLYGDYEFIKSAISLWYNRFHKQHEQLHKDDSNDALKDTSFVFLNNKTCRNCFFVHCREASDEKPFGPIIILSLILHENLELTNEILNTLLYESKHDWKTRIFLDHIEQIAVSEKDPYYGPLSLLETIFLTKSYDCILHPTIRVAINEKFKFFSSRDCKYTIFRHLMLMLCWITLFLIDPTYKSGVYDPTSILFGFKIFLVLMTTVLLCWDTYEAVMNWIYYYKRYMKCKAWFIDKHKYEEGQKYLHSISFKSCRSDSSINSDNDNKDFLNNVLAKKLRLIESIHSPYKHKAQYFEWTCRFMMFISIILHVANAITHNYGWLRAYVLQNSISILLQSTRVLYTIRLTMSGIGDMVTMIKLTVDDVGRFLLIFIGLFFPYVLLYWRIYSNKPISDSELKANMTRCLLNETACVRQNVSDMENFPKTLYTLFASTIGDPLSNYDELSDVEPYATMFLCVTFSIIVAVVILNFLVGLITSVLNAEAFHRVEKHRFMEKLKFGLFAEWRAPYSLRKRYYEKISKESAIQGPKIIKLNELNAPNIEIFQSALDEPNTTSFLLANKPDNP